eukprot:368675-Pyramimonas_sp.AAC.1
MEPILARSTSTRPIKPQILTEKFSGTGKTPTIGLTKLTSKLVSILEDYDAPQLYFDIINLEAE